jgi:hypothetical protein
VKDPDWVEKFPEEDLKEYCEEQNSLGLDALGFGIPADPEYPISSQKYFFLVGCT